MALLNDIYIHVTDEEIDRGAELTSHPVEEGVDIADHIKAKPRKLDISGFIVGEDAWTRISTIQSFHDKGTKVKYAGRNILTDYIITDFHTGHPYTVYGGCEFSMTIEQLRVAKSPYTPGSAVSQQVTTVTESPKRYHTVKRGDTLWSIAKAYYGDGSQYPKIYEANRNVISNPNVIKEGWKLLIP